MRYLDENQLTDALKEGYSNADKLEAALRSNGKDVPIRPAAASDKLHEFERLEAHLSILRTQCSLGSIADPTRNATNQYVDGILTECRSLSGLLKSRTGETVGVPKFTGPVEWGQALLAATRCRDELKRKLEASDPARFYTAPGKAAAATGNLTEQCRAANAQRKPGTLTPAQRAQLEEMKRTARGATLKAIEAKLASN